MNEEVPQNPTPEGEPPQPGPQQPYQEPHYQQPQYQPPQYQAAPPPPPSGGYYVPPSRPVRPPQGGAPRWIFPVSFVVGCLPWLILTGLLFAVIIGAATSGGHGNHVALIRIGGIITAGKSGSGMFGGSSSGSDDLVSQLEEARKDDNAKAIVIRINSPGGSPAGSEEVYKEIMRIRKGGKPVYVSMADVAASGGYYIASASDKIYADSSTLTGSIGVIWDVTDMSGLYKKIGFNTQVVKSGKFKDIGSPNRPMTPEERTLLQGIVMDTYGQFVNAVASGRKLPVAQVKAIADGRVFTGDQALKLKLVDKLGGMRETVLAAAKAGGISGEPRVKEYKQKGFLGNLLGDDSEAASSRAEKAVSKEILQRLLSRDGEPQGMR